MNADFSYSVLPHTGPCVSCASLLCRVLQYQRGNDVNREYECVCGLRLFIGTDDECRGSRNVTTAHIREEVAQAFEAWKAKRKSLGGTAA